MRHNRNLSSLKSRGYRQDVRSIAKILVAIANSPLLPLQYSALRKDLKLTLRSQGIDKMVSIKESDRKGVALCTFAREKRLRNQMLLELLGPEKVLKDLPLYFYTLLSLPVIIVSL